MSELSVVYSRVQLLKEQPWTLPDGVVEALRSSYRKDFGREITAAELKVATDGAGWILRMASEQHFDLPEILGVTESLLANCEENLRKADFAPRSPSDMLAAGVGAGFPTGLWVGRLLR